MPKAFTVAWCVLLLATVTAIWSAYFAMQWFTDIRREIEATSGEIQTLRASNELQNRNIQGNEAAAMRVAKFLQAWAPHINPLSDKKDRQMAILRVLEDEAVSLQDLLVGNKVTPSNKTYRFGDQTLEVEQVQMQVSGPMLKTLIFLGRAEELFPYARIKHWRLEPTEGGQAINLDFSLVQPVKSSGKN